MRELRDILEDLKRKLQDLARQMEKVDKDNILIKDKLGITEENVEIRP